MQVSIRQVIPVTGALVLVWALCAAAHAAPGSIEVHVAGPAVVTVVSGDDIVATAAVAKEARGCLLRDIEPGTYTVVASASGYASATKAVTVPDGGEAEVSLKLARLGPEDYKSLGRIVGFVKDGAGKPVTGAVLLLLKGDGTVGTARSGGPQGVYELEWYAPGTYAAVVEAAGYRRAVFRAQSVSAGASTRLDVELASE